MIISRRTPGLAFLPAVAALAALVVAAPAAATPPTREVVGPIPYSFAVDCGGFENIVLGEETLVFHTFYDATGNAVKVTLHDSFRETDTNSVSHGSLRFSGNRTDTENLVDGTRTVSGKSALMTSPGRGVVIHDAGRVVFDAPFHVIFEAGKHEVLHGDIDALACGALADV